MISLLLLLHSVTTPLITGLVLQVGISAALLTFGAVFAFQGINRIASEIESPFGVDLNDLPLALMQEDFNSSLWILLENQMEYLPTFQVSGDLQHRDWNVTEVRTSRGHEDIRWSGNTADQDARKKSGPLVSRLMSSQETMLSSGSKMKRGSFFAQKPHQAHRTPESIGVARRIGSSTRNSGSPTDSAELGEEASASSTPVRGDIAAIDSAASGSTCLPKALKGMSGSTFVADAGTTAVIGNVDGFATKSTSSIDRARSNSSNSAPVKLMSQMGSEHAACPMQSMESALQNARRSILGKAVGSASLGSSGYPAELAARARARRGSAGNAFRSDDEYDRLRDQMVEFGDVVRGVATALKVLVPPTATPPVSTPHVLVTPYQENPLTPREQAWRTPREGTAGLLLARPRPVPFASGRLPFDPAFRNIESDHTN